MISKLKNVGLKSAIQPTTSVGLRGANWRCLEVVGEIVPSREASHPRFARDDRVGSGAYPGVGYALGEKHTNDTLVSYSQPMMVLVINKKYILIDGLTTDARFVLCD